MRVWADRRGFLHQPQLVREPLPALDQCERARRRPPSRVRAVSRTAIPISARTAFVVEDMHAAAA